MLTDGTLLMLTDGTLLMLTDWTLLVLTGWTLLVLTDGTLLVLTDGTLPVLTDGTLLVLADGTLVLIIAGTGACTSATDRDSRQRCAVLATTRSCLTTEVPLTVTQARTLTGIHRIRCIELATGTHTHTGSGA